MGSFIQFISFHSLVRIGFVSSAYLGKDLKLLAVSLIQKNYLNVGIKRYGHLLLGFLKLWIPPHVHIVKQDFWLYLNTARVM